ASEPSSEPTSDPVLPSGPAPTTAAAAGRTARLDRAALEAAWARVPADAGTPGAPWRRAFAWASAWTDPLGIVDALDLARAVGRLEAGDLAVEARQDDGPPDGPDAERRGSVEGGPRPAAPAGSGGVAGRAAPVDPAADVEDADLPSAAWGAAWRTLLARDASGPADGEGRYAADLLAAAEDATLREVGFGVHAHGGVTWFRREGLRGWTAAWLAARAVAGDPPAALARGRAAADAAERASGYDWEALTAWARRRVATEGRPPT
ncbi:MAG: hypothetical protein RI554_09825, partial [Trueperaceae bacterium]|nr:hypothetical protein [Trueperaceae bacterium]